MDLCAGGVFARGSDMGSGGDGVGTREDLRLLWLFNKKSKLGCVGTESGDKDSRWCTVVLTVWYIVVLL